ncbi:hypothetical protein LTR66_000589 [Elasticomyces elasticus]|nr:hypothetical protein LTR28_004188 [Elasticomyces elasticus]KAK5000570.1 hypothetical protein LTR66_000589 [Elasticomyces elasticus]
MTKPKFAGKLVVILAGYDNDMNNLLSVNEGLSSRFADKISFPFLSPAYCLQLLKDKLEQSQIACPSMQDPTIYQELLESITEMSRLPSWGNARDVQTLAKAMVRAVYQGNTTKVSQLLLPAGTAFNCIQGMLAERHTRAKVTSSSRPSFSGPVQPLDDFQSVPRISSSTLTAAKTAAPARKEEDETPTTSEPLQISDEGRDAGPSDAVWQQLQKDKTEAELQVQRAAQKIKEQEEAFLLAEEAERERIDRELEKRKQDEKERRKKEELAQSRLRQMGVCVAGFNWIKQGGGYRCAGGSHWVDDSQLGV